MLFRLFILLMLALPACADDFGKDIRPLLETYCFKCHGAEKAKSGVKLHETPDLAAIYRDPQTWDRALIEMIGSLNPARTPFVVKVTDSTDRIRLLLMRHPVASRAFYTRFGLFSDSYSGVYCDDDFTARAYWHSVILDGRSLQLEHGHPTRRAGGRSSGVARQQMACIRPGREWGLPRVQDSQPPTG